MKSRRSRCYLRLTVTSLFALAVGGCSSDSGGLPSNPNTNEGETGEAGGSKVGSSSSAHTGGTRTGGSETGVGGVKGTGGSKTSTGTGGTSKAGGSSGGGDPQEAAGGATGTGGRTTSSGSGGKTVGKAGGSTGRGGGAAGGSTEIAGKPQGNAGAAGSPGTGSCTPSSEKFSFFVTSQARLFALAQAFNGSTKGFGGDLRYGETGTDAGLKGADKICTVIAEASMPGNCKTWKAFLSTTTQNAIDRIGSGPWYDRVGRQFGTSIADITAQRPTSADTEIKNDFPNEDGIPNHDALQTGNTSNQDNHDILTGSDTVGKLYKGTDSNCNDWTSLEKTIRPRVGHSWPMSGMGTFPGGGGGTTPGGGGGTTPGGGGFPGGGTTRDGGAFGGMGGVGDTAHWISALDENGCAPGLNLANSSVPDGRDGTVGGGGGYGALYCFALTP